MKSEYLNKWLIYSWSKYSNNRKNNLIHPEDLEKLEQNGLGTFLECVNEDPNYLTLSDKYGELARVKKEGVFRILPNPKFRVGDWVKEVDRPEINGYIYDFIWHDKDAEFKYYITINRNRKNRRYNSDELTQMG